MDDLVLCINSARHIEEGEALLDVVDDWQGELAGINGVECPMCLQFVKVNLCAHTKSVGFHYGEHTV